MSFKEDAYDALSQPKPLSPLETPNPEEKFPLPPRSVKPEEESGAVSEFSGIKEMISGVDEELVLEKVTQVRAASDAIVQLYRNIVDVNNWEPEEKWEMHEKLIKLSEAISELKHPNDLVKQAEDHNQRIKLLVPGKPVDTTIIESEFIHKAGEAINEAIENINKEHEGEMFYSGYKKKSESAGEKAA
ncbi:MAG: hypothetical protein PHC70_01460 [Patescibacteria group bacterium]|nr:hypothetical protein [Patescibacteria group bacterium]